MKTKEQAHALEESRAKWAADLGAREAALKQKEEAASASARRQQEGLRKRVAQDEQVHTCNICQLSCQLARSHQEGLFECSAVHHDCKAASSLKERLLTPSSDVAQPLPFC